MTQFAKITLLVPLTDPNWQRPDKTNWQEVTDHNEPITVLGCDYLEEDELPADATVGLVNPNRGAAAEQQALLTQLRKQEAHV